MASDRRLLAHGAGPSSSGARRRPAAAWVMVSCGSTSASKELGAVGDGRRRPWCSFRCLAQVEASVRTRRPPVASGPSFSHQPCRRPGAASSGKPLRQEGLAAALAVETVGHDRRRSRRARAAPPSPRASAADRRRSGWRRTCGSGRPGNRRRGWPAARRSAPESRCPSGCRADWRRLRRRGARAGPQGAADARRAARACAWPPARASVAPSPMMVRLSACAPMPSFSAVSTAPSMVGDAVRDAAVARRSGGGRARRAPWCRSRCRPGSGRRRHCRRRRCRARHSRSRRPCACEPRRVLAGLAQPRHLAGDDDALARATASAGALGQAGSQKPHSMQRSTIGSASGISFRFLMWTSGSALSSTPGLSRPSGSNSGLMRCMMRVGGAAPFALDEGRDGAAGAVLGLEASRHSGPRPAR